VAALRGVDDINAETAQAKSLGAKVILDIREVMGHGHMSVLKRPNRRDRRPVAAEASIATPSA
jgi:hypothetical protein